MRRKMGERDLFFSVWLLTCIYARALLRAIYHPLAAVQQVHHTSPLPFNIDDHYMFPIRCLPFQVHFGLCVTETLTLRIEEKYK